MFAHDQHRVFYVVSGDRIFAISLTNLAEGYRRAVLAGNDQGVFPAGEAPFAVDTSVIELSQMLVLDDGDWRRLTPVDLRSGTILVPAVADAAELARAALLLWADYCDDACSRMDVGLEDDDALRLAGTAKEGDAACE